MSHEFIDDMQKNYLHSVPKRGASSRRVVLIFRKGNMRKVAIDSGINLYCNGNPQQGMYDIKPKKSTTVFGIGQLKMYIEEGKSYTRDYLWRTYCHR